MTALPPATDFTGASVTQGEFKTSVAALRAYLNEMFGSVGGTPQIVDGAAFRHNAIINGHCEVVQGGAVGISTSPQYGKVDMFTCWATGTAVSAGSITQDTASPIGRTGKALKLSAVTVTGTGIVYARYRMESADAVKFKNANISFAATVYHDVGSTINYTIVLRKPTAQDNFASMTTINTSSALPVPTATGTRISVVNLTIGDCTNGLEIEVQAACGAITTKNFSYTEFQLEESPVATAPERRPYP